MELRKNNNDVTQSYTEVPDSQKEEIKSIISSLIVTAVEIETENIHKNLKPIPGYKSVAKMFHGNLTYFIGCFGNYAVIHVQCGSLGSMSRDGSITTVLEAINSWNPKAVIMIGIAFGRDKRKQQIGDVLLSEAVIPYNIQRIGKKKIYRNPIPPAGGVLLNRFKNFKEWNYTLPCGETAKVFPCQILSGESLIDNPEYKEELFEAFPSAGGGEMEGAGVYAAAENKKIEWIVVKGICDYADGNKFENKNQYQDIAAKAATSFCLDVFSSKHAFKELNFFPIDLENQGKVIPNIIEKPQAIRDALFDVYKQEYEKYYIERDCDLEVKKLFDFCGLWISGPTGCGKTCCIFRNLIQGRKNYIYITLASCIDYNVEGLLNQILIDLYEKLEGKTYVYVQKESVMEITKDILLLLERHLNEKKIYILVEEIPIDKTEDFSEFVFKLSSMLITVMDSNVNSNVRFIFSSINSPKKYIRGFQKKIHEKIKFLDFKRWENNDIIKLLDLIMTCSNTNFSTTEKQQIIEQSKGCPRFIKTFFRNYLVHLGDHLHSLDAIIKETQNELGILK